MDLLLFLRENKFAFALRVKRYNRVLTKMTMGTFEFFHNSRLIRRIQQNKIYKKLRNLTRDWTQITCLTVRHLKHYTRMFSVLVWGCNWILFMLGWFCPIRLIHLIWRTSRLLYKGLIVTSWLVWLLICIFFYVLYVISGGPPDRGVQMI